MNLSIIFKLCKLKNLLIDNFILVAVLGLSRLYFVSFALIYHLLLLRLDWFFCFVRDLCYKCNDCTLHGRTDGNLVLARPDNRGWAVVLASQFTI